MASTPPYFKDRYRVESSRLEGWDYRTAGYYFITICTRDRIAHFGEIVNGEFRPSSLGKIAHQYWIEIPNHFPHIAVDEFVVMPNHVHGIVVILDPTNPVETHFVETQHAASLPQNASLPQMQKPDIPSPKPGSISVIVRSYKSAVTRWAGMNDHPQFAWQARFYDHIIRDEKSLEKIRNYICANPIKWEFDKNYI